jgi:5-dehydro-2-deoxygluconokinase
LGDPVVTTSLEVLTVGRVGVDLYPLQAGVPLSHVSTFARFLGGTATNVSVGAARLGHRAALLTKVGDDEFGVYVREALVGFGVDPSYVGSHPTLLTPVVFCALNPPEDPPLYFYRQPIAPDLTLTEDDVPWEVVADVPLFWVTGTGVSVEPARSTQLKMLRRRGRPSAATAGTARHTVLDLDWRPMFWASPEEARPLYAQMLQHATVAVGNRAEVEVAVGTSDPREAARRLLDAGLEIAFVKQGGDGVLVATRDGMETVPPHPVEIVCGLGAGDAFGAAIVHGLLSGWDPVKCARYANASGALVASRLACADAMPTIAELEELVHESEASS